MGNVNVVNRISCFGPAIFLRGDWGLALAILVTPPPCRRVQTVNLSLLIAAFDGDDVSLNQHATELVLVQQRKRNSGSLACTNVAKCRYTYYQRYSLSILY